MAALDPTKLEYFTAMEKLQSTATIISICKEGDAKEAMILDSTIFHPQGGGQPADTGVILVFHYGKFEIGSEQFVSGELDGKRVELFVDEARRKLNSRLHSAGHLIDVCLENVGLGHLEPGKGYHFPDGPYVEYKGTVPQDKWKTIQTDLELEANSLISRGGKITVAVLSYEDASNRCGGSLPDYISKSSTPRVVTLGNHPGCPCGGTHVSDIGDIESLKAETTILKTSIGK